MGPMGVVLMLFSVPVQFFFLKTIQLLENWICTSRTFIYGAVPEGHNVGRKDNTHSVESRQGHDVGRKIALSPLSPSGTKYDSGRQNISSLTGFVFIYISFSNNMRSLWDHRV